MTGNVCDFCRLRSERLELCFKRPRPKHSYIYLIKESIMEKSIFLTGAAVLQGHEKILQPAASENL